MAATGATLAFEVAMKLAFLPNHCVGSHIPVILVAYEPSFIMHIIMPISYTDGYVCHALTSVPIWHRTSWIQYTGLVRPGDGHDDIHDERVDI